MSEELKPCEHENIKNGTFAYISTAGNIDVDYEICTACGLSRSADAGANYNWQLNPYALQQEYLTASKLLRDRTSEEINALIEKYGDPQYKVSEFVVYDLISVAQQLQNALKKSPWIKITPEKMPETEGGDTLYLVLCDGHVLERCCYKESFARNYTHYQPITLPEEN